MNSIEAENAALKAELASISESNRPKLFRFHWRHGDPTEGCGRTASEAFSNLGYGAGAMAALDFYEEVKDGSASSPEAT